MWLLEQANERHVWEVLSEPAPQTLDDLDGEPIEDAVATFTRRLTAHGGEALVVNGQSAFVLGHVPTGPRRAAFWFIASRGYYALGAAGVTFGRRYLARLREQHPAMTFTSLSNSQHPATERWFSLLGFEFRGVSRRFAMVPK